MAKNKRIMTYKQLTDVLESAVDKYCIDNGIGEMSIDIDRVIETSVGFNRKKESVIMIKTTII